MKIDRTTAVMIQKADEHASIKGEVLFQHQHNQIKYGLWVNVTKNPRIKRVDFSSIGLSTDLPKNLALTSVAIRMMHFAFDYLAHKSLSEYQAVGGILYMELLALPPPPKKVKGWTLRQITPLANNVSRLNYPPAVGIGVEVSIIIKVISLITSGREHERHDGRRWSQLGVGSSPGCLRSSLSRHHPRRRSSTLR